MQKEEDSDEKNVKRAAVNLLEQALTSKKSEKKILEKINYAMVELEKSGQGVVSLTGHESRFMKNKKKRTEFFYRHQWTTVRK